MNEVNIGLIRVPSSFMHRVQSNDNKFQLQRNTNPDHVALHTHKRREVLNSVSALAAFFAL